MFGRKRSGKSNISNEQVFEHIMSVLYGMGEPGALITPGLIFAARDLSKGARRDALEAASASEGVLKKTEAAYDHVGSQIRTMFSGPHRGAVFPGEGEEPGYGKGSGYGNEKASAPCPSLNMQLPHNPVQLGDGPVKCYYCEASIEKDW